MGSRIRLIYQGLVLDLNDHVTYSVEAGFIPPAVQKTVNYAAGSIINQRGGKRISEKALDRNWSFTVIVEGASPQETHLAVRQIQNFLNLAADTRNKLYVEYYPSDAVPYKPTWGQLGYYYQVKAGTVESWDEYAAWSADHVIKCTLNLTIAPYAEGSRQQLCEATGGILEDILGSADGSSRGLAILEATTNIFTNPVFGYYTWNNGWTTGGDLLAYRNVDPRYILFDRASAQLVRHGATNIRFYQSLNCGNTNMWTISFYCKKPDESAVTSSDIKVYYSTSKTTTYEAVGNGWYLCYASVTGINAATNTGVELQTQGQTVYVDGFQMEQLTYPTRLCYGDLLGCAWSGTKHASTSTRTAARCRVPSESISNSGQWVGTYRTVVKFHHAYNRDTTRYIWGSDKINLYFDAATDTIRAVDGAVVAASSALTFAAGAIYVIHVVFNLGTVTVYLNGVSAASNTGFGGGTAAADIYLGSTNAAAYQGDLTVMDFTSWDVPLTGTQIDNDYDDIIQQINADTYGKRVSSIPYFWNPDGDMVFDHYYDSTHEDWAVVGGVPGSGPAKSILRMGSGPGSTAWVISNWTTDIPINMTAIFEDLSGTVVAGALGGQVQRTAVAADGVFNSLAIQYDHEIKRCAGRQAYIMAVLSDAGTGLSGRVMTYYNSSSAPTGYSDYRTLAANATLRHFLLGPLILPEYPSELDWLTEATSLYIGFTLKRATGSADVDGDYYRVLIGDITYILGNNVSSSELDIDSDWNVWEFATAGSNLIAKSNYQGNQFQLYPGQYNHLVMLECLIGGVNTITDTLTMTAVYVTPVYDLL